MQQRWPGYRGGANHESLCEAQAAFLNRIDAGVQLTGGARRATDWRPLHATECVGSEGDPDRTPHVYYWHRDRAV